MGSCWGVEEISGLLQERARRLHFTYTYYLVESVLQKTLKRAAVPATVYSKFTTVTTMENYGCLSFL